MSDEIKPGVKSTEFWTAILGAVVAAVPAVLSALSGYPWVAGVLGVAAVGLPALYIWGRAILKAEQAKQTDIIPDAWEPVVERAIQLAETLAKAMPAKKNE